MIQPMRDLPSGTVTFVFTDIEGSTSLLTDLGDEYVDVLAEHRRILRFEFAKSGGVEAGHGETHSLRLPARRRCRCGGEGSPDGLRGPVRVRIGVHTGEPLVTPEGYVGIDVHRAARIAGAAHGGQVVLSQTTRDLIENDADLRDLGLHRLKA